jgi:hypothetical protein
LVYTYLFKLDCETSDCNLYECVSLNQPVLVSYEETWSWTDMDWNPWLLGWEADTSNTVECKELDQIDICNETTETESDNSLLTKMNIKV